MIHVPNTQYFKYERHDLITSYFVAFLTHTIPLNRYHVQVKHDIIFGYTLISRYRDQTYYMLDSYPIRSPGFWFCLHFGR